MRTLISRWITVALGIMTGIALAGMVVPSTVSASPNLTGSCLNDAAYACYARGTFNDGSTWGGGYVQTQVVNLTASGSAYLNEEMWVGTNGNSYSYWAEVGYSDNNPYCPGSFSWFYYYQNPSSSFGTCFGSTPSAGTWHQLEVQEVNNSTYDIYLDNTQVGTDTGAGEWTYNVETGLEYHDAQGTSFSGDAYYSYNEVRSTSCCSWSYWPEGGQEIEYPSTYNWQWTQTNPWIHAYNVQG